MRLKVYFSISEIYHSKICLNLHRPPCTYFNTKRQKMEFTTNEYKPAVLEKSLLPLMGINIFNRNIKEIISTLDACCLGMLVKERAN